MSWDLTTALFLSSFYLILFPERSIAKCADLYKLQTPSQFCLQEQPLADADVWIHGRE